MLNTILFLVPLMGLCLSGTALLYVVIFRLTVLRVVVREGVPVATAPGELSYAGTDLAVPLLGRRSWLVIGPVCLLGIAPIVPLLAVFIIGGNRPPSDPCQALFPPFVVVTGVAAFVLVASQGLLAWRAARKVDRTAPPAATYWPMNRAVIATVVCLFALLGSMALIEVRARWALAESDAEVEKITSALRKPGLGNVGGIYEQAFALYKSLAVAQRTIVIGASVTPFPPAAEPMVSLLRQATESDKVPTQPQANVTHWAKLLYSHAVHELQIGHFDEACKDLAAMQTMARQCGHGTTFIDSLITIIVDGIGEGLVERVANVATSEAQLDAIPLQPRAWHETRMRRYRETYSIAIMSIPTWLARGAQTGGGLGPPGSDRLTIALQRWVFLDHDLEVGRRLRLQVQEMPVLKLDGATDLGKAAAVPIPGPMLTVPMFGNVHRDFVLDYMQRDLADAGLAVLRYRMRNGRLPATMDDVVAAGLLPAPPVSPWDGKPVVYAATPTGATLTATLVGGQAATFTLTAGPTTRPANH